VMGSETNRMASCVLCYRAFGDTGKLLDGNYLCPTCYAQRTARSSTPTGWLCPACGRGNAPRTATCPCKALKDVRTSADYLDPEAVYPPPPRKAVPENKTRSILRGPTP